MANSYQTVTGFKAWLPTRYNAELTDDTGGQTPNDEIIQQALDEAADDFESGASVRDDIPIPALNSDGTVPRRILQFMNHVSLYNLLSRRTAENETVTRNFDIQMTWLDQIVTRRKNVKILDDNDNEVTETIEKPVTGNSRAERKFDDFHF